MFRYGEMYDRLSQINKNHALGRMKPCKVLENTYFVGTYQASCHLIDTGDGLIMIDPGYSRTALFVLDSIHALGFCPKDIRYIVNTHWHGDHTEATADFAALTGAKTLIGRDDAEKAARYFTPDILVDDGDTLTLGNVCIHFLITPGHTKGTLSFFYDVEHEGKMLRFGSFGGAGVNTLVPGKYDFEGARDAYRASLHRLQGEHVDVFLGNHTWNNDTYGKSLRVLNGEADAFADKALWNAFLAHCEQRLDDAILKHPD